MTMREQLPFWRNPDVRHILFFEDFIHKTPTLISQPESASRHSAMFKLITSQVCFANASYCHLLCIKEKECRTSVLRQNSNFGLALSNKSKIITKMTEIVWNKETQDCWAVVAQDSL